MTLLVNRISTDYRVPSENALSEAAARLKKAGIGGHPRFYIYRRSVDARKKDRIRLVYTIAAEGDFSLPSAEKLGEYDIAFLSDEGLTVCHGAEALAARPVIVGTGPCGLFCALLLAEQGYAPVLLERGGDIRQRQAAVHRFFTERILDTSTNIQFGAGGAGTFSDGKLITRIGDPLTAYVLRTFVRFGAPADIVYMAKPHIGTDILSGVVENILKEIVRLGGEVMYHTTFLSPVEKNGRVTAVHTDRGDIPCGALVLAVGHSARDTYGTLMKSGVVFEAKSFSVGMRIEHLTEDIDTAMYGDAAGHPALGHAEYALSHNTKIRGVYTFCMCPGGEVVAATSEAGHVVVNGMSRYRRDGRNSNCAVVCSIFKEDYGATPAAAIAYQSAIEKAAFSAGGADYSVPLTTVGDFLDGTEGTEPRRVLPTYMNGAAYRLTSPERYLPPVVTGAIRGALSDFDRKIRGFAARDAVLSGAETRTSAPIRMPRDAGTRTAVGYDNLYPAGEGAGYAGGITSAAADGLHTALAILARFAPPLR